MTGVEAATKVVGLRFILADRCVCGTPWFHRCTLPDQSSWAECHCI